MAMKAGWLYWLARASSRARSAARSGLGIKREAN
jgi:hypothetical protein